MHVHFVQVCACTCKHVKERTCMNILGKYVLSPIIKIVFSLVSVFLLLVSQPLAVQATAGRYFSCTTPCNKTYFYPLPLLLGGTAVLRCTVAHLHICIKIACIRLMTKNNSNGSVTLTCRPAEVKSFLLLLEVSRLRIS